ncbi:MAG TPA: hypothetical protein PLH22_01045 [Candidatus Colwellbacteria bacterium]|jgi:hypothetical protein|nr:hypothetical protein [Candidatus Colwellbacteria bacterium]
MLIPRVLAQDAEEAVEAARGLIPACDPETGCGWEQFVQLLKNGVDLIFKIVPFVALYWIVYGGFEILTAGGDKGKFDKGKGKIQNAIIGLVLVYGSVLIYNTIKGVFSG